jgi:hypothetical protein
VQLLKPTDVGERVCNSCAEVADSDGKIKYILPLVGLPHGLTEEAIIAAKRIEFIPAMRNGQPVPYAVQIEYNFNLY